MNCYFQIQVQIGYVPYVWHSCKSVARVHTTEFDEKCDDIAWKMSCVKKIKKIVKTITFLKIENIVNQSIKSGVGTDYNSIKNCKYVPK